jgi:hypothetical protein
LHNLLAAYMTIEEEAGESSESDRLLEKKSILLPRVGDSKRSILLPRVGQEKRAYHMPRVGRRFDSAFINEAKKSLRMPRIG